MLAELRGRLDDAIEARGSVGYLGSEEGESAIAVRGGGAQRRPNGVSEVRFRLNLIGLSTSAQSAEPQGAAALVVQIEGRVPGSDVIG